MHVNSVTNVGLVRKSNEDKYLADKNRGLFVVADGMGGHEGGEIASDLAIKSLDEFLTQQRIAYNDGAILEEAVKQANKLIYGEATRNNNCSGMGTTMTAALFYDTKLWIAHIGDSRAYLISDGRIQLLTKDHSIVGELIRHGEISETEAINHPHRNVLTRALGTEADVEIDLIATEVKSGDLLLLCTDGLSNLVDEQEILENVLANGENLKSTVNQLVKLALERGGNDNITVVLVCYDG